MRRFLFAHNRVFKMLGFNYYWPIRPTDPKFDDSMGQQPW
jgi:hypothetical protein